MRLINVIAVTTVDIYEIIDVNDKIISRVYWQYDRDLSMNRCENCGTIMSTDIRHCSCGVFKLPNTYVFEEMDRTRVGKIHLNRGRFIPLLGWTYRLPTFEIYDARNQFRATLYHDSPFINRASFRANDRLGNLLALYRGDWVAHNYEILAPEANDQANIERRIILEDRNVIARIQKENGNRYYIYYSRDRYDSFLVLSYVIAMDIMMRAIRNNELKDMKDSE